MRRAWRGAAAAAIPMLLMVACTRHATSNHPTSPPSLSTDSPTPVPVNSPVKGHEYWAVYVAVSDDPTSTELDDAIRRLQTLGIEAFNQGLSCDTGAAGALKAPEDADAVAVYFQTQADAMAFAQALEPPPAGVVDVTTNCGT